MIETDLGSGTGWLIDTDLILTNQHVVGFESTVLVRQSNDPAFFAQVIGRDLTRDIALLKFSPEHAGLNIQAKPIDFGNVGSGDIASPIMALGYSGSGVHPAGNVGGAGVNTGVLSQIRTTNYGSELIVDAPFDPGDSGGPILNLDGEIIGMIRAAQLFTPSGQRVIGTFYGVHIDEIRKVLSQLRAGAFLN